MQKIARHLNGQNLRTKSGLKYNHSTVSMFRREVMSLPPRGRGGRAKGTKNKKRPGRAVVAKRQALDANDFSASNIVGLVELFKECSALERRLFKILIDTL